VRPDPALPDVFTVTDAERAGLTRSQVETRLRNGEWHRLRRGVFCRSSTWRTTTDEGRHLLTCAAVQAARRESGLALSHSSAAVVHGMPVSAHLLDRVTATRPPAVAAALSDPLGWTCTSPHSPTRISRWCAASR
jgi:hypothetical protein